MGIGYTCKDCGKRWRSMVKEKDCPECNSKSIIQRAITTFVDMEKIAYKDSSDD